MAAFESCFSIRKEFLKKKVSRETQGSYQPGEPGEPGVFWEKRLSLQVIREKAFFEEISGRNMML